MSVRDNGPAHKYSSALVTGASGGIGNAIALRLAEAGLTVYGTSRDPEKAGLSGKIQWLRLEASTESGLEAFCREHSELLSSLDILVNNAGSSCFGKASAIPSEAMAAQQHLLLQAPIRLTEQVIGPMRHRGRGVVVNISSLAALFPLPYMAGYSSAKAGLSAYTQALMAVENTPGLVLIDFQPGDYRTDFNVHMSRYGEPDPVVDRAWNHFEKHLARAPLPDMAADDVVAAIMNGRSRTVRSGAFFQRSIAPLGCRLFSGALLRWAVRKYYRLP